MEDQRLFEALKARGYRDISAVVRTDGMMLFKVNEVFMFRQDLESLATGASSLAEITTKNEGKIFPDAPSDSGALKTFRELRIKGNNDSLRALTTDIEGCLANGWFRDTKAEEFMERYSRLGQEFCFACTDAPNRVASNLWLSFALTTELKVSNVVPRERDSLSIDEYNAILLEFHDKFVRPAAAKHNTLPILTAPDASLECWLSAATANSLREFSNSANRTSGTADPREKERWHAFLVACHKEGASLDASTLKRWLQQNGWDSSLALDLALEYERGRSLLKAYDGASQSNA